MIVAAEAGIKDTIERLLDLPGDRAELRYTGGNKHLVDKVNGPIPERDTVERMSVVAALTSGQVEWTVDEADGSTEHAIELITESVDTFNNVDQLPWTPRLQALADLTPAEAVTTKAVGE